MNEGFRITYPPASEPALRLRPGARRLSVAPRRRHRPGRGAGPGRRHRNRDFRPPAAPAAPANARAGAQRAQVDQLLDFAELVEGDYIVHLQHGIAHFRGLQKLDSAQGMKEVISLEFDDGVTLHVPLSESHLVSRYVGLSKVKPQLGRIGSGRWEKTRRAAERATLDLAADLLQIQARREAQPGQAFAPDTAWQKEFEASFPFTETPDQLRAIADTKADMERTRPMDRLICGDVGFGKTEVAIRAAFKAVQDGRQVAVLVPTTILAQQHLNTFRERMAGYPVAVEMLSRFRTARDQKEVLAAAAAGQVDILIGTHRLLQRDVKFKDLGLVVIDEEQRFGVKHKEVFKRMRETVDVLSMSATPIPRTLYLALTGARDLSVIETAPTNRHPIQTIVKTYDEKVVVDAIRHEIRRGGQVFYLHNRVATIDLVAARFGQTCCRTFRSESAMGRCRFLAELRAGDDRFCGRKNIRCLSAPPSSKADSISPTATQSSSRGPTDSGCPSSTSSAAVSAGSSTRPTPTCCSVAHTRLLDIARQRLAALRQHNQLGAGFRIAMRDLELRGAGNLLGAEQSGHVAGVGFELYCQLLRQSVARLKGDKSAAAIRVNVEAGFRLQRRKAPSPTTPGAAGATSGYTAIKEAEDSADGAPIKPIPAAPARDLHWRAPAPDRFLPAPGPRRRPSRPPPDRGGNARSLRQVRRRCAGAPADHRDSDPLGTKRPPFGRNRVESPQVPAPQRPP